MTKILFIFGTRPEVIKIAPVILACQKEKNIELILCNTGQQRELSEQTLKFFELKENYNLDVMTPNQTLTGVQTKILTKLQDIISQNKFDYILVQGDTMSAFCGALIGFYNKIPVGHIEAGLRSYNLNHPFPEEGLRQCISRIADLHFAPTKKSEDALLKENISKEKIFITGNTVVDALKILGNEKDNIILKNAKIPTEKDLILITAHRRENHGKRLDSILEVIKKLAKKYSNNNFIIPVHPNPNVKEKVYNKLSDIKNIFLKDSLDYPILVQLLSKAKLILTDFGGIQEEAPSFGCPTLVLRDATERMEGVEAGFTKLVGADKEKILSEAYKILDKSFEETRLNKLENPYGDGKASEKIIKIILENIKNEK
jgi:UDP-N-acetylglucosamine 2-epimerase (non-hydrolysing)